MRITAYLHASRESMYDAGKKAGLTGEALDMFSWACHEIEVQLDVDERGLATIVCVDGIEIRKS